VTSYGYRDVWLIPGGPGLLVWGLIGRLGIGMTPLALLLVIQHSSGRYTPAAIASGLYALAGAAAGPGVSRLADRIGPAHVLQVTAFTHPIALVVLLAVVGTTAPIALVWVLAAVAGALYPPSSVSIRGAWSALTGPDTHRHHLRPAALAAETTMSELVYAIGPLLVSACIVFGSAATALGVSAMATLIGTMAVARGEALHSSRHHPESARARGLGPLRVPGFTTLLGCALGLCVAFGAVPVAVPGYASAHAGARAGTWSGVLLGLWGLSSAAAGIWFGTRRFTARLSVQFAWLLGFFAVTLVVLALMPNLPAFAVALFLGGTAVAPVLTLEYALVARLAPPSMVNEAYAWLMAVAISANSIGAAVTGPIVDHHGAVPWSFAFCAATVTAAAIIAGWPGGPLSRATASSAAPAGAAGGTG
jgi:MFS family permease